MMATEATRIQERLWALSDTAYKRFQSNLLPTLSPDSVMGVRTPELRRLAKRLNGSAEAAHFLAALPHQYYDENNLHAALLEHIKDFDTALAEVERFLPYIDNWATCDGFCPKCLRKDPDRFLQRIGKWLTSSHPYTVRYALVRLTAWYLDDPIFTTEILALAAAVESEEYYVKMAQAWFFSIALVKQYETTIPYLTEHRLPVWVHNKAIQKAVESYRPSPETKSYLKTLKRQNVRTNGGML